MDTLVTTLTDYLGLAFGLLLLFVLALPLAIPLGLIPWLIVREQGRSFVWWWIYGTFLFVIALIHAILLRRRTRDPVDPGGPKGK
jgi:hypothetical protein